MHAMDSAGSGVIRTEVVRSSLFRPRAVAIALDPLAFSVSSTKSRALPPWIAIFAALGTPGRSQSVLLQFLQGGAA
jgi:hypothetical protein